MTTLRTERLTLRPPTLDDAEIAGALIGDERVMRFLGGAAGEPQHAHDADQRAGGHGVVERGRAERPPHR